MTLLNNKNYQNSEFERAEELDSLVCVFQRDRYRDIKWEEFNQSDDDIKTFGKFLEKDPYIFISTYNHNDEIILKISENTWELKIDNYKSIINEDLDKIIRELKEAI